MSHLQTLYITNDPSEEEPMPFFIYHYITAKTHIYDDELLLVKDQQAYLLFTVTMLTMYYFIKFVTGQSKAKYKLNYLPIKCLECRNSKSDRLILHTFICEYLSFHTVYRLETLGIHLYNNSLIAYKVLDKSGIWPKI